MSFSSHMKKSLFSEGKFLPTFMYKATLNLIFKNISMSLHIYGGVRSCSTWYNLKIMYTVQRLISSPIKQPLYIIIIKFSQLIFSQFL